MQLVELQERESEIVSRGGTLVAVSSDPREVSEKLAIEESLAITLVCDPEGKTIAAWGLTEEGAIRSVPAAFVIDRKGKIRLQQVGDTIFDRVEIDDLLATLDGL